MNAYYDDNDKKLHSMLKEMSFLSGVDTEDLPGYEGAETYVLKMPDEKTSFLHELAITEFKGVLYSSWYQCDKTELLGHTPVCGARSYDEGKTWEHFEIIADDPSEKILYCPPVYGIDDGKLYMFINEMVSADHMHALDLYVLNEETDKFEFLWSRPIPFKLNTNVYKLPSGKLMLPGRVAELDGFPNTPAVLISDSGRIDAEWRLVKIAENGDLPDGAKYIHPELSAILHGDRIYIFSRNDERRVPIVYYSDDGGESWSEPFAHDIPFSNSKIYSGTLSDGRYYVIGNVQPGRHKLAIFFSEPGEMKFTKGYMLQNNLNAKLGFGGSWHYPSVVEHNGKLFIIYTVNLDPTYKDWWTRGAVVTVLPL